MDANVRIKKIGDKYVPQYRWLVLPFLWFWFRFDNNVFYNEIDAKLFLITRTNDYELIKIV